MWDNCCMYWGQSGHFVSTCNPEGAGELSHVLQYALLPPFLFSSTLGQILIGWTVFLPPNSAQAGNLSLNFLPGGHHLSKLDLRNAYHLVRIRKGMCRRLLSILPMDIMSTWLCFSASQMLLLFSRDSSMMCFIICSISVLL